MDSSRKLQPHADRRLADRAARRHNVVAIAELRGLGLSDGKIEYRVRVGRLHRQHQGIYSVGTPKLTPQGLFLAAVRALGEDAVLSHRAAAALWGLRPLRRGEWQAIDVSVPRAMKRRPGIRPRRVRTLAPRDVTERDGIRVTTVTRTLLDLAQDIPRNELRRAVNEALVQRRVTVPLLYRALEGNNGRRGAGALRGLLANASPTRSELEDVTLEFLRRNEFGPFESNTRLHGWEVDVLIAKQRLVIEADSAQFHDNPIARAQDARKQAALEALGYTVMRLRWSDVTRDETKTACRLARICAQPTSLAA